MTGQRQAEESEKTTGGEEGQAGRVVVAVGRRGSTEGVAQRFTGRKKKKKQHRHLQPDIKLKRREVQLARQREEEAATSPKAESLPCAPERRGKRDDDKHVMLQRSRRWSWGEVGLLLCVCVGQTAWLLGGRKDWQGISKR